MKELVAVLGDDIIGHLYEDNTGKPQFEYTDQWKENPDAIPLSLSLPLASEKHDSDMVSAVIWGLLPDNEYTLQRWATQFQVSARNPFALLSHVGEECAGAVAFIKPDSLDQWFNSSSDDRQYLDDYEIAKRLRLLRQDSGATRLSGDTGQFSLAGAQPKTALSFIDGQWSVPYGKAATTHILKPPSNDFVGYAENEHFCLRLASELELPTTETAIIHFEDEIAIRVVRYDRDIQSGSVIRIHQEDCCQALGVMPQIKYQNQGGPSPKDIVDLLRQYSSKPKEDVETFFRALVLNWLIGGTDAHAKNYSLLLDRTGKARLAPLYDISSILPYPEINRHKLKLSMKIGSSYLWEKISFRHWLNLMDELELDREYAAYMILEMIYFLPDIAVTVADDLKKEGLNHNIIDSLVEEINKSVKKFSTL